MDLKPSAAMISTAERGAELAERNNDIESVAAVTGTATAALIQRDVDIEPSAIAAINAWFSENTVERKPGWELTPEGIAYQLRGGDAGKVWAAARLKELISQGVSLSDATEAREFAEMYFDDAQLAETVQLKADKDGLIWKPMLVEGTWKIGPNGRPLKVVPGKSADPRVAIGMADLVEAHNAKAVAHVTIPKTHVDAVDENTGYVDKMKIVKDGKKSVLMGGHRFTDKDIEKKVLEGSIANTSVGIEFGYVRKDDGRKFNSVMRHNALTNSPWLGRKLPAFGLGEEVDIESIDNYTVQCAEYVEFSDDADVKSTTGSGDTISSPSNSDIENNQEVIVTDKKKEEETAPTAPAASATVDLSENPLYLAEKARNDALQAQVEQMASERRIALGDKFVNQLKAVGFDEAHGCTGFLKKVHAVFASDTGETAINLSEDDKAPRSLSAADMLREVLGELVDPTTSKVKVQLSEQQTDPFGTSKTDRPSNEPEPGHDKKMLSLAESEAIADAWAEEHLGIPAPKKEN